MATKKQTLAIYYNEIHQMHEASSEIVKTLVNSTLPLEEQERLRLHVGRFIEELTNITNERFNKGNYL